MAKPLRGEVEANLGGTVYTLRLGLGELEEIENQTGLGTLELLKSFGTNARISHAAAVLGQAITEEGRKPNGQRVRRIMEMAGFRDSITACVSLLSAVLLDPDPGNAAAAAAGNPEAAA